MATDVELVRVDACRRWPAATDIVVTGDSSHGEGGGGVTARPPLLLVASVSSGGRDTTSGSLNSAMLNNDGCRVYADAELTEVDLDILIALLLRARRRLDG